MWPARPSFIMRLADEPDAYPTGKEVESSHSQALRRPGIPDLTTTDEST
jgi:hypothetical protein